MSGSESRLASSGWCSTRSAGTSPAGSTAGATTRASSLHERQWLETTSRRMLASAAPDFFLCGVGC